MLCTDMTAMASFASMFVPLGETAESNGKIERDNFKHAPKVFLPRMAFQFHAHLAEVSTDSAHRIFCASEAFFVGHIAKIGLLRQWKRRIHRR